jgi:hypothetical protein
MTPLHPNARTLGPDASPPAATANTTNGSPPNGERTDVETEELTYVSVPARRSVVASVRCHVRGRGRPLVYPLEEGADK